MEHIFKLRIAQYKEKNEQMGVCFHDLEDEFDLYEYGGSKAFLLSLMDSVNAQIETMETFESKVRYYLFETLVTVGNVYEFLYEKNKFRPCPLEMVSLYDKVKEFKLSLVGDEKEKWDSLYSSVTLFENKMNGGLNNKKKDRNSFKSPMETMDSICKRIDSFQNGWKLFESTVRGKFELTFGLL